MSTHTPDAILLGLDVGTTNVKAVAIDPSGNQLALASRPQAIAYPRPGWAEHDPEAVWTLACEVLRDAIGQIANSSRIVGIAVTSMGEAGVTLDRDGQPTGPLIAWFDRRTGQQVARFSAQADDRRLHAITGSPMQPILTAAKLMWLQDNDPVAWNRTERFLNVSAWIAHRLGADPAQDMSLASRTGLFELSTRRWHPELLAAANLRENHFGSLSEGGTRIGSVSRFGSEATGLPIGAAIGMAGHDHVVGAFAAGAIGRGDAADSIGTAEGLLVALDAPIADPAICEAGITQGAHVAPGRYYALGAVYSAGASIAWAQRAIGSNRPVSDLIAEAGHIPAGSYGVMFVPHLQLAMLPHLDLEARGAFIGLSTDTKTAATFRAVLEGLAFEGRIAWDLIARFAELDRITDVRVLGGTAQSDLLVAIKASVANAQHHVLQLEQATAVGAAMLAGMAAGVYRDADDAVTQVHTQSRVIEPGPADEIATYETMYSTVYRNLYGALRPLSHSLTRLFPIESSGHA